VGRKDREKKSLTNVIGVIPARFKSTRFPGKPLADILGKPMIYHVYQASSQAKLLSRVVVATDDERIAEACDGYQIPWVMTSDRHPTGTDRVAEVAQKLDADLYVNIQGDEPMIRPSTIDAAITPLLQDEAVQVANICARIVDPDELIDTNTIKVVRSPSSYGIYLSRAPIPYPKDRSNVAYYKQVCVYAFRKEPLLRFLNTPQTLLERTEGVELLRFLEIGILVKFVEEEGGTAAVDTPSDLARVNQLMAAQAG
jgi:3-deoxy-manno-octulosonate cytidylyltransferase (CMP-KDO synthetase)